jgi:hypothetical protein
VLFVEQKLFGYKKIDLQGRQAIESVGSAVTTKEIRPRSSPRRPFHVPQIKHKNTLNWSDLFKQNTNTWAFTSLHCCFLAACRLSVRLFVCSPQQQQQQMCSHFLANIHQYFEKMS